MIRLGRDFGDSMASVRSSSSTARTTDDGRRRTRLQRDSTAPQRRQRPLYHCQRAEPDTSNTIALSMGDPDGDPV